MDGCRGRHRSEGSAQQPSAVRSPGRPRWTDLGACSNEPTAQSNDLQAVPAAAHRRRHAPGETPGGTFCCGATSRQHLRLAAPANAQRRTANCWRAAKTLRPTASGEQKPNKARPRRQPLELTEESAPALKEPAGAPKVSIAKARERAASNCEAGRSRSRRA